MVKVSIIFSLLASVAVANADTSAPGAPGAAEASPATVQVTPAISVPTAPVSAAPASAVPVSTAPALDTKYQAISKLHSRGTRPTQAEIMGWWAGRCFQVDSQERPRQALLVAFETRVSGGAVSALEFRVHFTTLESSLSADSDHFDHLTAEGSEEISSELRSGQVLAGLIGPVTEQATSLRQEIVSTVSSHRVFLDLRKSGDYLTLAETGSRGCGPRGVSSCVWDMAYCYYFKKLQ